MKGSIQKYQTKKGTRYRLVVDLERIRRSKRNQKKVSGFTRKKDAEAALLSLLNQSVPNRNLESSQETFENYIEEWFTNHYRKRVKETTYENRKEIMRKHLIRENVFVKKELAKITTQDIDELYNDKLDQGYSTSYIRKMHQMLNKAFAQAVKWNKISANPVLEADPPSVKIEEMRIWPPQEIKTFLNVCADGRFHILFLLALYTGMRRGEILGLQWNDINFSKKYIHVKQSLSYIEGEGYKLTKPKTEKSIRKIPVSDFVLMKIREYKKQQDSWKERLGEAYENNNLVICTEYGKPQDPRNILRTMKRLIKVAGVKNIRFHDLRHTHASILISEGVDLVKIAARLGHANPRTTLSIYGHLVDNTDHEVADIFDEAVNFQVTK